MNVSSKIHVFVEEIIYYFENNHIFRIEEISKKIKKILPNLSEQEITVLLQILKLQFELIKSNSVFAEFVATIPIQLNNLNIRQTIGVLMEHIYSSNKSILITGYSISEFSYEIIRILSKKAKENVEITFLIDKNVDEKLFINKIENIPNFKVFKLKSTTEVSNLHAKIAVFDSKHALITSSNMSYRGMVNNIEVGTIIHGEKVIQLEKIFKDLLEKNYFERIY